MVLFIYILAIMILLVLIVAYVSSGHDLFYPWVMVAASFFICTVLALLNLDYWQYGFHANTCLVIIAALSAFGVGSLFASHILGANQVVSYKKRMPYSIPWYLSLMTAIFVLLLAVNSARELYQLSVSYGNSGGYAQMLPIVRRLIEDRLLDLPRSNAVANLVALSAAICFMYYFIYNFVWFGWRKVSPWLLLPVLSYLPHVILSTGRLGFLLLTISCITITGFLYQQKNGSSFKNNVRIIMSMGVIFVLFFGAFFTAGSLTWKGVSAEHGPFKVISHYAGAQIPALDSYLNGATKPEDEWIGTHTLIGPYGNLRSLGVNVPNSGFILEFTAFANVDTNIYTPLRRYIQDYGFMGMIFICLLLGILYTAAFHLIKCRGEGYALMVYTLFAWPLFTFGMEDNILARLFGSRTIYFMILLAAWFWGIQYISKKCVRRDNDYECSR